MNDPAPPVPQAGSVRHWFKKPLVVNIVLTIAVLLAFWPVTQNGYIEYDDPDYVTENSQVKQGLSWSGVAWAFTSFHASNWHPLTWISHMLDVELFGQGPSGPHWTNLLLHALNSVLVFAVVRRFGISHWVAVFVAFGFALHPLRVESVAWVSERKDVLSALFGLLTLLSYVRFAASEEGRTRPALFYGGSLFCFALGLMSKPMLVTWPFVLLLLDYSPLNRIQRGRTASVLLEKVPFLLLAFASSIVTLMAQTAAMQPLQSLPLANRIGNAAVSYGGYIGKTLWPVDLAVPYPHPGSYPAATVALASAILLAITLWTLWRSRHERFLLVGWLWFLGTLIPVIGLVQVGAQAMADRYMYLPSIGLFMMIGAGLAGLAAHSRVLERSSAVACAAMVMVWGWLSQNQSRVWKDDETLFTHTLAVTRDNYIAMNAVGGHLFRRGELDRAMELYQRAFHLRPGYTYTLNNIGAVLDRRGDPEALHWFEEAIQAAPSHAGALHNAGNALARQGKYAEALQYYESALKLKPADLETLNNYGFTLLKANRPDEAVYQFRLALRIDPKAVRVHKNLGTALVEQGEASEAEKHLRVAVEGSQEDAGAHYFLGLSLALRGRWPEAVEQYEASLQLEPHNAEAAYNLGYAHRVQGARAEAAEWFRKALTINSDLTIARYNLACVLADTGQIDDARRELEEVLKRNPQHTEARAKLTGLMRP